MKQKNEFKYLKNKVDINKIKISNSIVVGGMIAFGKTTLVNELSKNIKEVCVINEFHENDNLSNLLLEKMYEREDSLIYSSVFQLYFVLQRFTSYIKNCNQKCLTIFDRSIFEDRLFALENIKKASVVKYYESLWKEISNEIIYEHGIPKLYVILSGDWKLFEKRLFERNRVVEIKNFQKNKKYFQKILSIYEKYMINVCKKFNIRYLILDANKPLEQKVCSVLNELKILNN